MVIKRGEGEGVSTQMGTCTCNSFCAGSNLAMMLGTLLVSPSIHVCFQETAVSFCTCRFITVLCGLKCN